jgi:hypothetical protein
MNDTQTPFLRYCMNITPDSKRDTNTLNTHTRCMCTAENNNALYKQRHWPATKETFVSIKRKLVQRKKLYKEYNSIFTHCSKRNHHTDYSKLHETHPCLSKITIIDPTRRLKPSLLNLIEQPIQIEFRSEF